MIYFWTQTEFLSLNVHSSFVQRAIALSFTLNYAVKETAFSELCVNREKFVRVILCLWYDFLQALPKKEGKKEKEREKKFSIACLHIQ